MLFRSRIAVTNSIVLSVQVSRLQTQLCGVVVADLEAKRMNVYKYYIAALDRLNQCRDQRDAARSQWDKLKKKREAEKATVAKNDLLELQIKQAEKAYEDALAAITKAEAEFHKVMRVHARAFAQLGLGNSMLAEYQDMLVNAEFSVAGGPRIRHEPRRIEEIARAPESTEVLAAAKAAPPPPPPAPPDFFTQYRWWIVGGIGAVVLVAVAFAFAKK